MTSEEPIRFSFSRDSFSHPSVLTHWEYVGMNNWEKNYTRMIVQAHHLMVFCPNIGYDNAWAIVNGSKTLTAIDTDEFYGIEISKAE